MGHLSLGYHAVADAALTMEDAVLPLVCLPRLGRQFCVPPSAVACRAEPGSSTGEADLLERTATNKTRHAALPRARAAWRAGNALAIPVCTALVIAAGLTA